MKITCKIISNPSIPLEIIIPLEIHYGIDIEPHQLHGFLIASCIDSLLSSPFKNQYPTHRPPPSCTQRRRLNWKATAVKNKRTLGQRSDASEQRSSTYRVEASSCAPVFSSLQPLLESALATMEGLLPGAGGGYTYAG